jgi:hypothetical protein
VIEEARPGAVQIDKELFANFGSYVAARKTWEELPDWFERYWRKGRPLKDDHKAFQADLDRDTPEARAFLIQLLKWKLTK